MISTESARKWMMLLPCILPFALLQPAAPVTRPHLKPVMVTSCQCANTSLISALERLESGPNSGVKDAVPPPRAHDPTMALENGKYYVYTTGPGIPFSMSNDLVHWVPSGKAFKEPMSWTAERIPGSRDIYWAPDIVRYRDRWLMFYAVSTFGNNRSAIGLATNKTLDPNRKEYQWKDEGVVVETTPADNWNAIDPNFVVDEKGKPWLAVGSFWSGIKIIPLDAQTCKPDSPMPTVQAVAQRPNTPEIRGAIEAPYILRHSGYFYLFASFDFCCRGVNSTYNVRVGRSKSVIGPYVDKAGVSMLQGGGTQVLFPSARWKGPGHNGFLHTTGSDRMVFHAYDAEDNGMPKLRISTLTWGKDGWPVVPSLDEDPPR